MAFVADLESVDLPSKPLDAIVAHVRTCGPNDQLLNDLTLGIQAWDHVTSPKWAPGTERHSEARRAKILLLLGFDSKMHSMMNERILRFSDAEEAIVIAGNHQEWYEERKRNIRDFYWGHYIAQLAKPRGSWNTNAIGMLDASIDDVIARLSDPTRAQIYPVKGLVMGYVQSGKTSHFSGLITKAADAGYRLIIVLAGTLDILRAQTQRRIDKEIVGRELLDPEEYGTDTDWAKFVSHGGRPSDIGYFDWERLTDSRDDYDTLRSHLSVLEFRRAEPTKPFNHPDNLRSASAKIAVIKKVPSRINKLCDDLKRLAELRSALQHVPTLVIDDESDQASVNTIDQRKPGNQGKRPPTNEAIGRLLGLLPRAQYVGYTATPFANVFIDPEDAQDLFPKDFIISLPRPDGYMGVSDFYDFDVEYAKEDFRGNQNAFVRPVEGSDESPENLPKAIDSFVLAGALKLFREKTQPAEYRLTHHTMLVHHSSTTAVHDDDRVAVERIFARGARYQQAAGLKDLQVLFNDDFKPVSRVRSPEAPFPKTFVELKPFISDCISRICVGKPVRVVNGEGKNRDDTPAFDQAPVWAILVGGAKLSRGYTVEGLTISYYRRPTGAGDTLMQMGRWFGFRPGYRDLVRLFIGSKEPKGKVKVNLYEAFGAVCRDEESLRTELGKYAKGGLLPRQVPPLVRQHLPQLPVTSSNKRFNAEIRSRDFAGEWTEKTSAPTKAAHIQENRHHAVVLLRSASLRAKASFAFVSAEGKDRKFDTLAGMVSGREVERFLSAYRWADGRKSVSLESEFIKGQLSRGELKQWVLLLPQAGNETVDLGPKLKDLAVIERSRVSESRFGVYSEPRHREAAAYIAVRAQVTRPSRDLSELRKGAEGQSAVLVLYLVKEKDEKDSVLSIGFGIQYPGEKKDKAITWTVRDKRHEVAVLV
jgi:hypothetical protein